MFFFEVISHDMWSALAPTQVAAHAAKELDLIARPKLSEGIGLHVLIEQLVGVKLGAVARQEEEADLPPLGLKPGLDPGTAVDRVPIDNEIKGSIHLPLQALQERQKQSVVKPCRNTMK
jgi:hypothetical protein